MAAKVAGNTIDWFSRFVVDRCALGGLMVASRGVTNVPIDEQSRPFGSIRPFLVHLMVSISSSWYYARDSTLSAWETWRYLCYELFCIITQTMFTLKTVVPLR